MGSRGPIPKRSDERVRRNKVEGGIEKVRSIGVVAVPPLMVEDPHPATVFWFESLRDSVQSQFYQASDWAFAQVLAIKLDHELKYTRGSAQMMAVIQSMMTDLLVTEGSRRRARIEVERAQAGADVIDVAEMFRARLSQG
jgi:hypothetical protein